MLHIIRRGLSFNAKIFWSGGEWNWSFDLDEAQKFESREDAEVEMRRSIFEKYSRLEIVTLEKARHEQQSE